MSMNENKDSGGLTGRELDKEIAVRVMGYVVHGSHWPGPGFWLTDRPYEKFGHGNRGDVPKNIGSLHDSKNEGGDKPDLWSPTTQIATAMEVLNTFDEWAAWKLSEDDLAGRYQVEVIRNSQVFTACADTLEIAICNAATLPFKPQC